MNTPLNADWTDVLAVLGSLGVVAMMLLLIVYVQLWRHRIHRIRRAVGDSGPLPLPRAKRHVQPKPQSEERIHEYLENADFTNEGNPNLGWKDRFRETRFI